MTQLAKNSGEQENVVTKLLHQLWSGANSVTPLLADFPGSSEMLSPEKVLISPMKTALSVLVHGRFLRSARAQRLPKMVRKLLRWKTA